MASNGTELSQKTASMPPESVLFGCSEAMVAVRRQLESAAGANVPVLLEGESGTGKDVLARVVHQKSPWNGGPFVKVNCPAIPGSLLESELFGYEQGAFTGANVMKPGRVEQAHRGTLFLDEITELELGLQSKLLQLLQDGQFCRIGAQADRRVDVRLVCATNRRMEAEIEAGRFRQDLFYRINVITVRVPTLRERVEDIPILVDYFVEIYNDRYNRRAQPLSRFALETLSRHNWPGNIRELENVIKRYVILGSEDALRNDLPTTTHGFSITTDMTELSLKKVTREAVRQIERQMILKCLQANQWNRKRAARALHISYRALLYKLKDVGIARSSMPADDPAGSND